MQANQKIYHALGFLAGLATCLLAVAWLYWPGLHGPQLLDDGSNLRALSVLEESDSYWVDVVLGNSSGLLGRSVSMASFALERISGISSYRGIKFNNLMLHLLSGCLVTWLAYRLYRLSLTQFATMASLFVGAFWLLTPFFVSTVLYIIQRMAQLSTLFMLAGLLSYCIGREQLITGKKGWLTLACVPIFALLAVFSKENGVLIVPLLLLIEVCFFRYQSYSVCVSRYLRLATYTVCLGGAIASFVILYFKADTFLWPYAERDFTLYQRLLTESRVLWKYIFHLIWPSLEGLGIYHDDYQISKGLFNPYSTAIALLGWLTVLLVAVFSFVRGRLLFFSFGMSFFLIGHLIESTFIPLELYFEHRNYLPAFGIYFGLLGVLFQIVIRWPWFKAILLVVLSLLLAAFAVQTGKQSVVWSNPATLAVYSHIDHPGSGRSNAGMARLYAVMGEVGLALKYSDYLRSISDHDNVAHDIRDMVLYCFSNQPLDRHKLLALKERLEKIVNVDANDNFQLLVEGIINGRCPKVDAVEIADLFADRFLAEIDNNSATPKVFGLLAVLENHLQRYQNASRYADYWLKKEPEHPKALLMQLFFSTILGDEQKRHFCIEKLLKLKKSGKLTVEQKDDLALFL